MKKQLLKSMLVGVMTLAASGAWAQTVTTYDFEDGNALFTADSRISASVVEGTQTIYSQDFDLDGKAVSFKGASNAQNGYSFAHYDFSSLCDQAAKVKVEFETVLGNGARSIISIGDASVRGTTGNSSKTTYSNKGAIFRVGTDKSNSYVNGNTVGNSTIVSQKWLKVTIEVDEVTKNYTYSIVNKATNEVLFSNGEEPIAFYSSDATNCTQIDMFGYINNSQMGLIDNLIITVTKDEREQANYTVNFLDSSNNPIKEAAVRSGAVGDGITLLPADKDPLWNAESTQKYIYQSDDSEGKTIEAAGTTVVNIIYRDAVIYNYTLLSNLGATLATGSDFEGESPRVGYPRYQLDGTDLYMAAADNKEYRTTVNLTEDNVSKTVTYTLQEGKVVAFYTEAEDIAGITVATNDNIPVRASNALAATTTEDVTITTLAPGKYILHAGIFTSKSSYSGLAVNFGVGAETFAAEFGAVNLNEVASGEYGLDAPTAITYLASSSDNTQLDYIWIEKTGDVTADEAAFLNAKAQLQEAIAQATALNAYANDADLATAIDNATAALANDAATLETLLAAGQALNEKVTAAAGTLKTAVSEAKSFFNTFDKDAAADLADEFTALETAFEGTDVNAIIDATKALYAEATPAAKTAIGKVKGYLEVMNNETITQDLAALQTAMDNNDFPAIIAAAKQAKNDLTTAVPAFLTEVKALVDAGKADGKNGVDALETAYNDANTAIMAYMAAGDNGSIVPVGEAIYNLVKAVEAYEIANRPDPTGYIVNAEFSPVADPIGWTPVRSEQFNDLGMGLIGTYQVRTEHPAASVDETHLDTEYAAGLECRWATNFAAYTQTTVEIPAGAYKLTFDVENTNANTTKANYENRFTVTVGETVYTDESTEWMQGKSAWTTHTIPFALTEASPITISLGYGTGSNNYGVNNTPALFVSHLKLEAISALDLALAELQKAIEAAEALVPTYPVGEGLFYYAASEIEPLNQAIADAKAAYTAAESETAVKNATETLNAFVSTFAPAMTVPAENKLYAIANATATGNLCISTEKVTVKTGASVFFTAVEGGYVLSNEAGEYIFKTGNNWTLSTTTDIASAYVLTFVPVEGGYTIKGAKGLLGLDSTDEGSTVYADKTQANNGLWTIEEVSEDEALTKARQALTDEIAAAEALKTADRTKGLDEFNAAIVDAQSATTATTVEELTAALQALKTAEQTFKVANAVMPEGKYYLVAMALEDNNLMAAGMDWGTRGIVNGKGLDLNVIYNADADNYNIETNIHNGSNHFLGSNLYMDSPAFAWSIEEDAVYGHCIYAMFDGVKKYLGVAADSRLELTETPYAWGFFYADAWEQNEKTKGLQAMENATVANAVDATFLLKDADFNRNDHRWEAWTVESGSITNLGGGCDGTNGNGCAEAYQKAFTLSQIVADAPAGTYGLTAQGFYRQDNGVEEDAPYFFINDAKANVTKLTGTENSMTEAGKSFEAGNYTADMALVYVPEGGQLKVGISCGENVNQWVIWDNFVLTYYGPEDNVEAIVTAISEVKTNGQKANEGIYNLSGQKVMKAGKGLYIINGKKVVK